MDPGLRRDLFFGDRARKESSKPTGDGIMAEAEIILHTVTPTGPIASRM
jgi:hypothetical protein